MPRARPRCSLGNVTRHAIGRDVSQMFRIPKVKFLAFSKLLRFRFSCFSFHFCLQTFVWCESGLETGESETTVIWLARFRLFQDKNKFMQIEDSKITFSDSGHRLKILGFKIWLA